MDREGTAVAICFLLWLTFVAAYGTAAIVNLKAGHWAEVVIDIVIPPVGIVDGIGIWLGAWS